MSKFMQVVTTLGSREEADNLAKLVLKARLAACAQIAPCESLYHWEGAIAQEQEYKLTFKTPAGRYAELEALIRRLHPYQVPEIIALPIEQASADYAAWLEEETGKPVLKE